MLRSYWCAVVTGLVLMPGQSVPGAESGPRPTLRLAMDGSLVSSDGGLKVRWFRRASAATRFDPVAGKLVDVGRNQARFEQRPGRPWGGARGVVMEGPAENRLTHSSFETGLTGWTVEPAGALTATAHALHGRGAIVSTKRCRLTAPGIVLVRPDTKGSTFACVSVYARRVGTGSSTAWVKAVRPSARTAKGGPEHVRNVVVVPLGRAGWVRIVGRFHPTLPGEKWICGFTVSEPGIELDAAQLEAGHLPYVASSYIPTGATPAKRAVEDVLYPKTDRFRVERGSLALWLYVTNPYDRVGWVFSHGPCPDNRLYLSGGGATVGKARVRWTQRMQHGRWCHVGITWDGQRACLYQNGRESAETEGPFPYTGVTEACPYWRVGGNGITLGAEGLVADVQVFTEALTAGQMARLCRTGKPGPATTVTQAPRGLPITFTSPGAGTTSVAVYDGSGVQVRELVLGEKRGPGRHTVHWDGRDRLGQLVPPGAYTFKGLVANLKATYELSIGNTGKPPWDWEHNIHGGVFLDVAAGPERTFYVCNLTGEGNRHMQKLKPDGQVIWTSPIEPSHGSETACAADGKYMYIVTSVDMEKDAKTLRIRPREVVWRLSADTGRLVPWPTGPMLRLNDNRDAPDVKRVGFGSPLYAVPPTQAGVHGMAAGGGRLFVSLHQENAIAVYDRDTGKRIRRIEPIASPRGLGLGADGALYVVTGRTVVRVNVDDGSHQVVVGTGLVDPYDVAGGRDGTLYVTDLGRAQQIKRFDRTGRALDPIGVRGGGMAGGTVKPDRLTCPLGLTLDSAGQIIVADYGNGRVQRFDPQGRCTLSVMAPQFGGLDGGIDVLRDQPERVFYEGINSFGRCIVEYRADYQRKTWELVRNWQNVPPIYSKEPLFVRRIDGRIYLFWLTRNPSVFELKGDRLEFCAAIVNSWFGLKDVYWDGVREDVRRLGLLDKRDYFNCCFVWTDANRDRRMQADEITRAPARRFYTVNDGDVDAKGNIVVHDHYTASIVRYPNLGFDRAGNPTYRWDRMETLWSLEDPPRYRKSFGPLWLKTLKMFGTRVDDQDNVYFSDLHGPVWTDPPQVSIQKYAPGRRLMWHVGRKARGLKDKPGEFQCVPSFCGIHRGLLFINEYQGQLDIYSLDGLYAATLLENLAWGKPGPYQNWGENFFSTIFDHPKTGVTYAILNTHNFHFPCYRIDGIDGIQRFQGQVTIDKAWHAKLARLSTASAKQPVGATGPQVMTFAPFAHPPAIDGRLNEWADRPSVTAAIEEAEAHTRVQAWGGYDSDRLYVAFDVTDATPALNDATPGAMWNGDALELYLSTDPKRLTTTGKLTDQDYIIHVACTPSTDRARVEVSLLSAGKTWNPPGAQLAVVRRPDKSGYRVELAVPWDAMRKGWRPRSGQRVAWDWNVNYSTRDGKGVSFKVLWTPETAGVNYRSTAAWDRALFAATATGKQERTIARATKPITVDGSADDWPTVDPMVVAVEDAEDRYRAATRFAHDPQRLYLVCDVRDPDPGLSEASTLTNLFSGDAVTLWLAQGKRQWKVILIAHRGRKTAVYDPVTRQPVRGSRCVYKQGADGKGYVLEAAVPWSHFRGLDAKPGATLRLNWAISWSDAQGGNMAFERAWVDGGQRQQPDRWPVLKLAP